MTHNHTDLTFVAGLGHATVCKAYGMHRPKPLRFVWHHILPQNCGGETMPTNLVSLCDSCHYSTHALLWLLAKHEGDPSKVHNWKSLGTDGQRKLALQGYDLALAAGTVAKIPDEGVPADA